MGKKNRKKRLKKVEKLENLKQINLDAAGIDIGADEIFVCVPEERDTEFVRQFGTFTVDLEAASDWLSKCGITTVAMESTGVLWIPLYELLTRRGFEVFLINAKHIKNVPGKKTDVVDCQWIQKLHTYGLLQNSFRPTDEMVHLRSLVRQRGMLLRYRSAHIQHMQKALQEMNLKLDRVVSDVTGTTGMRIIRAIVSGERDVDVLASYRDGRCKNGPDVIAKALVGNYREEHLFALKQAVELYDFYTMKINDCDTELKQRYSVLRPDFRSDDLPTLPPPKRKKPHGNEPDFDLRLMLYEMIGVDLTAVEGISSLTVQTVISEIGVDMSRWPTAKHFASWLGLSPNNHISGGRILKRTTSKTKNRAAQALRMASQSLHHSKDGLGIYYRKMKAKHGPRVATNATAHKLARIIYTMLKKKTAYVPLDVDEYEQKRHEYQLKKLKKQAAKFGLSLTPTMPA